MVFLSVLMLLLNVGMRIVCAGLFYHLLEFVLVKAYILNGTKVLQKLAMCHIYLVFLMGRKLKKLQHYNGF
jgi:hypothetical protein